MRCRRSAAGRAADRRAGGRAGSRGGRPGRRGTRPRRRGPVRARSSRPTLTSTSSSGSRGRRCRCSSRPKTTPGSHGSGSRSARRREHARPVRGVGAGSRAAPFATRGSQGSSRCGLAGLAGALVSGPASGGRGAANARRGPPGKPASGGRAPPRRPACDARPLRGGLGARASGRRALARTQRRRSGETSASLRSPRSPETTRPPPTTYADIATCSRAAGAVASLSTYAPQLGRSLCALGRYDEAEPLAQLGRELGGEQDFATQMLWRQVQALVHAHRGEHAEAERLAREAVAIAERTDALNHQGDALCDLAEVLPPPAAPTRPPTRSSRHSNATSARRTSPWPPRCIGDSTRLTKRRRPDISQAPRKLIRSYCEPLPPASRTPTTASRARVRTRGSPLRSARPTRVSEI